ncbi:MAG TPA: hypothetical protein VMT24_13720, partial [Aggregatilineaceae bacterium]|nr:hypothetical protein [Aggregatilineaceae bacterium]
MSAVCQRSIRFRSIGRLVCLFIIAVAAASAALYTGRIASVAAASDAVAWVTLGNGAAYTWLPYVTTNHQPLGDIFVVRIVPHAVLFRIYYRPGNRKTVADWAVEMPGAAIIANASFFNGARQPMGLVKIGGAILSPAIGTAEHGLFSVVDDVPQVIPAVTIP